MIGGVEVNDSWIRFFLGSLAQRGAQQELDVSGPGEFGGLPSALHGGAAAWGRKGDAWSPVPHAKPPTRQETDESRKSTVEGGIGIPAVHSKSGLCALAALRAALDSNGRGLA